MSVKTNNKEIVMLEKLANRRAFPVSIIFDAALAIFFGVCPALLISQEYGIWRGNQEVQKMAETMDETMRQAMNRMEQMEQMRELK